MSRKVIVTNWGALQEKYGKAGLREVDAALQRLVKCDAGRGVETKLVKIDSTTAMKPYKARAVTQPGEPRQSKETIDAIFRKDRPDYLLIAGSVDVVPHQDLLNPVFGRTRQDDPDEFAYSDLPYACEAPYSQHIEDFTGPTRVVGRLPDLTETDDPAFFLKLIDTAILWKTRSKKAYERHLGISAEEWKKSSALSLRALFGSGAQLHTSPTKGPQWGTFMNSRVHFINCHGAPADPQFYGQKGPNLFPVAHRAQMLKRITEGTVVAAECCYGAELYSPSLTGGQPGICSTYLAGGAYGFFGSSTIAYGPADTNGAADLLCQYFLKRVLGGASLGRAALEARQLFVAGDSFRSLLDPINLKTLAQFNLLGDPSIHPVAARVPKKNQATSPSTSKAPVSFKAGPTAFLMSALEVDAPELLNEKKTAREMRREQLSEHGHSLAQKISTVSTMDKAIPTGTVRVQLTQELRRALKLHPDAPEPPLDFMTFTAKSPLDDIAPPIAARIARSKNVVKSDISPSSVHMALARIDDSSRGESGVRHVAAVVCIERPGGQMVFRHYFSK